MCVDDSWASSPLPFTPGKKRSINRWADVLSLSSHFFLGLVLYLPASFFLFASPPCFSVFHFFGPFLHFHVSLLCVSSSFFSPTFLETYTFALRLQLAALTPGFQFSCCKVVALVSFILGSVIIPLVHNIRVK